MVIVVGVRHGNPNSKSGRCCLHFALLYYPFCPWCIGYRYWKWTRWYEFKSWARLIAFHIVLILLGNVWIPSFSFQLYVNSKTDWVLLSWFSNQSRGRKTEFKPVQKSFKIYILSRPSRVEELVNKYITLGKGMNLTNLFPHMYELKNKLGPLTLVWQPVL